MPVAEMLERISSRELAEWMAYSKIESDRMQGKPDPEEDKVENKIKAAFMQYRDK